jgi:tellurite methyltransferase
MNESPEWQWDVYYRVVPLTPKDTLLKALQLFYPDGADDHPKTAIDLGCGHGPDTLELLKRGWRVLAIDSRPEGLEQIRSSLLPEWKKNVELRQSPFDGLKLESADLVNASTSLPFCRPEHFMNLGKSRTRPGPRSTWRRARASLKRF